MSLRLTFPVILNIGFELDLPPIPVPCPGLALVAITGAGGAPVGIHIVKKKVGNVPVLPLPGRAPAADDVRLHPGEVPPFSDCACRARG